MSEQGHPMNVNNAKRHRDFLVSFGLRYAPPEARLQLTNINSLIAEAEAALDGVAATRTPYRNATAAAQDVFKPLSRLVTRIMNRLKISGVSPSVYEDAQTYARKIQGKRKKEKDPESPEQHSASQMGRAQRVEAFKLLIALLKSHALYAPTRPELKTVALDTLADDLETALETINTTFVPLATAWNTRDAAMYAKNDGLVAVMLDSRDWVQSELETADYNLIKGIKFETIIRKSQR